MNALFEALRFCIYEITRFVSPSPLALEWAMAAAVGLLAWRAPRFATVPARAARRLLRRIAASPRLSIALCGALPVVLRLLLLPVLPPPEPSIHDEFSHLLLADTLAHGRLTNPTHPMWRHFETIHVIQRPTYNSMYPPANGAVLAAGWKIAGSPWAGVVLAVGAMAAAVCWMMQGWLPRNWALYGTLLLILKIGVIGFWMNSYFSAAVPSIGGALLVGALPRVRRFDSRPGDAWAAGLGLVILMNSRPFEGAVLALAGFVYLLPALRRRWSKSGSHLIRVTVAPIALAALCGIVITGWYSWRVTGNPLRMPYQVNRDTYGWPENLGFLPAKQVELHDPVLRSMYEKEVYHRDIYRSADRFLDNLATRLFDNWTFLIGPLLTVPLALGLMRRNRRTRALSGLLAVVLGLNLFQMVLYPYHLAPVVAILFALMAQGARRLYVVLGRRTPRRGLAFAALLPLAVAGVGSMKATDELRLPLAYWERAAEPHGEARADIERWLEARGGKHLVIVRYAENHPPDQEWVYNGADIEGSSVVWAREVDPESDEELIRHFSGRDVWLVDADSLPYRAVRYDRVPPEECAEAPGP